MTSTTYHNSPVKNCATCAHRVPSPFLADDESFDHCRRWGVFCATGVHWDGFCGASLKEWRQAPPPPPKPERRSLRQWLRDTLWK